MGKKKYTKWTEELIEKEAAAMLKWMDIKTNFWLKDFAVERGYYPQKFTEFADKNDFFSEALKKAKAIQESKLIKMGLSGKWNAAVVIFTLKNIAGWRDKFDDKPDNSAALEKISRFVQDIREDKEPREPEKENK